MSWSRILLSTQWQSLAYLPWYSLTPQTTWKVFFFLLYLWQGAFEYLFILEWEGHSWLVGQNCKHLQTQKNIFHLYRNIFRCTYLRTLYLLPFQKRDYRLLQANGKCECLQHTITLGRVLYLHLLTVWWSYLWLLESPHLWMPSQFQDGIVHYFRIEAYVEWTFNWYHWFGNDHYGHA